MSLAQISWRKRCLAAVAAVAVTVLTGCEWRGLNSLSMPGTEGGGDGAFIVRAQLPDVGTIEPNSRVPVGDVNVGTITKIELQDWHALVTMRLNGDVELPANARATVGQTSLLGSTGWPGGSRPASPCRARCTSSSGRRPTLRRRAGCRTGR